MEFFFLVKSSSRDDPYDINVTKDRYGISILCNCQAGERDQLCKHKLAVIKGDESILYDEDDIDEFSKAIEWINNSQYPNLIKALNQAEEEYQNAQKKLSNLKRQLARHMRKGLK